tara:strand:+ start:387 stop:545 length:159 start_codon:yes stop_codon:yes gene_type:complete
MEELLPDLNMTEKEGGLSYWHIHLQPDGNGDYQFIAPNKRNLDLEPYRLTLL